MTAAPDAWWVAAFGADYSAIYAHRDEQAADAEVAAVLPRLLPAGGRLCEACCGGGRHLAALRRAGCDAVGFDYSAVLTAQAAARAGCAGRVVRGDVRLPPLAAGSFAAVTAFFTAWGYFDDADNAAALGALGRLLADDGVLLLDLPDPAGLAALVPVSQRQLPDGRVLEERRHFDGRRVEKDVHIDGQWRYRESVRIYGDEEFRAVAANVGLTVVERWPSLLGLQTAGGRWVWWLRRR
jgi:SAM-dependent methyltransferase